MMYKNPFPWLTLMILFVGCGNLFAGPANWPFSNSYFAEIDGVELHFRRWEPASDSPRGHCLLLHGFSGSTFSWEAFADSRQSLGYEVVALDVPPFGYSDKSPRLNQSVTARATLIHHFLQDVFSGHRWHLTGHSMGGGIVQAMALMYPEVITGVCFVAPTLFATIRAHDDVSSERNKDAVSREAAGRRSNILSAWPLRPLTGKLAERFFISRRRIGSLLASAYGQQPNRQQVEGYLTPLRIPGTAAAILASGRYSREIATLDASDLAVPAIAIWGENDTWVPYKSREKVSEKMS